MMALGLKGKRGKLEVCVVKRLFVDDFCRLYYCCFSAAAAWVCRTERTFCVVPQVPGTGTTAVSTTSKYSIRRYLLPGTVLRRVVVINRKNRAKITQFCKLTMLDSLNERYG